MQILKKMPPFTNVGANLTAVLPIMPQGMTYERLVFVQGGTAFTPAMMSNIRVILGGKRIVDIPGDKLDAINAYYKDTKTTNYTNFWFVDPNAKNRDDFLAGALDTSRQYSQFSIEVDVGAATAPTLDCFAVLSAPIKASKVYKDMFRTMIKSVHAPQSANEFTLTVPIGTDIGALIRAIHFFHAQITKIQIVKDGFYLVEQATNALNQALQNDFARTSQAGLVSYDPMVSNFSDGIVPTLRADGHKAGFEIKVTVAAADTITAYSDLLQKFEGI